MAQFIQDNGLKTRRMVTESRCGLIIQDTRGGSKMVSQMVVGNWFTTMVIFMRVSGLTIKQRVQGLTCTPTVQNTTVSG